MSCSLETSSRPLMDANFLVEEPGGLPGDVQNPQYWIARPHISVGGELYFT